MSEVVDHHRLSRTSKEEKIQNTDLKQLASESRY